MEEKRDPTFPHTLQPRSPLADLFPMLVSSPDVDRPNHRESRLPRLPSRAQSSTLRCADSSTVNSDLCLDFLSGLDMNLFSEL